MPTPDFFARLGLFVASGFFDSALCVRLRTEFCAARRQPATTYEDKNHPDVLNRSVRSTSLLKVAAESRSLVDARLEALRPALQGHFGVPLRGWEKVSFLSYAEGDHFQAHRDANPNPEAPDHLQVRRVSIVLFLNREGADYGGGILTFYGLLPDPRWATYGFPLGGEEGLLVAFRADVVHEVTPVTRGERFTLVTWFY